MKKLFTKPVRQLIKAIAMDYSIESLPRIPDECIGYGEDGFEKGKHVTLGQLAHELRWNCLAMNGDWLPEEEENTFYYFEKAGFHVVNIG